MLSKYPSVPIWLPGNTKKPLSQRRNAAGSVPTVSPEVQQAASEDPIRFRVGDAVDFSVVGAVLLRNLAYWIQEGRKERPDHCWQRMSPPVLAKHLPSSERTIRRALEHLVESGKLERVPAPGFDQGFLYRFRDESDCERSNQLNSRPDLQMERSEMQLDRPEPQTQRPESTIERPNLHSVTILEDSVGKPSLESSCWEESVCEKTFINPPAAPSGSCESFHTLLPETQENSIMVVSSPAIPAEGTHRPAQETKEPQTTESSQSVFLSVADVMEQAKKYLKRPVVVGAPSSGSSSSSVPAKKVAAAPVSVCASGQGGCASSDF